MGYLLGGPFNKDYNLGPLLGFPHSEQLPDSRRWVSKVGGLPGSRLGFCGSECGVFHKLGIPFRGGVPSNKDNSNLGFILGRLIYGNYHIRLGSWLRMFSSLI